MKASHSNSDLHFPLRSTSERIVATYALLPIVRSGTIA